MSDPTLNQNNLSGSMSSNTQVQSDLPPMPNFSNTSTPSDTPVVGSVNNFFPPDGASNQNKKYGGKKIIATFLGVLLLVAGIATGIVLVLQPQLLQQKASVTYDPLPLCKGSQDCSGTKIPRSSACTIPDTTLTSYCCESGVIISNGACGPEPVSTPTATCTGSHCPSPCSCGNSCCSGTHEVKEPNGGTSCINGQQCSGYNIECKSDTTNTHCFLSQQQQCGGSCEDNPVVTPNPTPTPVPLCNSACTTNAQCSSGLTCSGGFCRNPACTSATNCLCATPTPSPSPSPSPSPTPGPTAQCTGVKAYDSAWTELSNAQLSGLNAGNNINFCVTGSASTGIFDMARFTINNVLQAETTTKRPTTNDFCQEYTIPANVYSFNVTAEIHHVTMGWVGP